VQLADLHAAMTLWRHDETNGNSPRCRSSNLIAAAPCGRSPIAASTLADAPVFCGARVTAPSPKTP
jgi:hypothetical protein